MRFVDAPLRLALGRTPRELVLLSAGTGYVLYELAMPATVWANLAMYAVATVAFALRFFPARAIGVGVALGALAQRLPDLRVSLEELWVPHFWIAIAVVALLASSDLEERFDRAPSRIGWLPNAWAALPARDMRVLRWCTYALGMLAAILAYEWGPYLREGLLHPAVMLGMIAALGLTIALLAAGRAPALLLVPLACAPIAVLAAREVATAEAALAGSLCACFSLTWFPYPQHALPALVLAIGAPLLASPYLWRFARRALG